MKRGSILLALMLFMVASPLRAASDDVRIIADYFEAIENLKANFLQIGPNGETARGVFFYRKPGLMRFSYNSPSEQVVIADDTWLSVQEKQGKEANRFPLKASPLGRFITSRERLDDTDYLSGFDIINGRAVVTLMNKAKPRAGRLELIFSYPQPRLLGWRVSDLQQQITQVVLSDVSEPMSLTNLLFFVDESETEFD